MTHITLCILFTAHCAQCTSYRLWKVQRRTLPWGQMSVYCTTCIKYVHCSNSLYQIYIVHCTVHTVYIVHMIHTVHNAESLLGDICLYIYNILYNVYNIYVQIVQGTTQSASSGTDVWGGIRPMNEWEVQLQSAGGGRRYMCFRISTIFYLLCTIYYLLYTIYYLLYIYTQIYIYYTYTHH